MPKCTAHFNDGALCNHVLELFNPFQPTVIWVPWRHFTTSNLKEEEIAHACLNNKMDED